MVSLGKKKTNPGGCSLLNIFLSENLGEDTISRGRKGKDPVEMGGGSRGLHKVRSSKRLLRGTRGRKSLKDCFYLVTSLSFGDAATAAGPMVANKVKTEGKKGRTDGNHAGACSLSDNGMGEKREAKKSDAGWKINRPGVWRGGGEKPTSGPREYLRTKGRTRSVYIERGGGAFFLLEGYQRRASGRDRRKDSQFRIIKKKKVRSTLVVRGGERRRHTNTKDWFRGRKIRTLAEASLGFF